MPKINTAGRPRKNYRTSQTTMLMRCLRAQKGKPTMKKRLDIIKYIRFLKHKFNRYGIVSKKVDLAIEYREGQLKDFDYKFGESRARARIETMRKKRQMVTKGKTYEENIEQILKILRSNGEVEGFTLLRTCKVERHPTMIRVLDLEDKMTLCVQGKINKNNARKEHADRQK